MKDTTLSKLGGTCSRAGPRSSVASGRRLLRLELGLLSMGDLRVALLLLTVTLRRTA
jgi:hypothetical protein